MKNFILKSWKGFACSFIVAILFFLILLIVIPKATPLLGTGVKQEKKSNAKEVIHFVAIGDSLTEGIGDLTNSGGFVPLVAKDLQEKYDLNGVETDNFGKNGDRSDQILKRIKKNEEIQKSLQSADIITLTVGGNDLMKVVKGDIFKLTKNSFEKPLKNYQKVVENIFKEIRKYNDQAPIYVLGIYNPFYLYFEDLIEMQDIVDVWNNGTKETVSEQDNAYFIPINDLLYKGTNGDVAIVSNDETSEPSGNSNNKNDALYEEDRFHPNNLGYQIMASALRDEIIRTQNRWLPK
ncbi:SGNH/GDSL hydrolase family protein [Enterococcus rivorum]|uniref:Lipase n=1 Tax=Enterococcus rivorum TaxID=762845 RepID=A0A1E5KWF5_9ENTE|nr:SGNH/GDSL hydrolase family protein [Enterococcus rivorum]MBP2100312.1 lysophospholipase L1-like esterase [Enterococcus rivorum]OEH81939.1 lipase [Enterococcus rivorum]